MERGTLLLSYTVCTALIALNKNNLLKDQKLLLFNLVETIHVWFIEFCLSFIIVCINNCIINRCLHYSFRPSATCVIHDGVCHGQHGETGDCCTGTYCHKNHPTWAEGRCYFVNSGNEGGEKK